MSTRHNGRSRNELRPIQFTTQFTKHAEGSVLVEFGDTKVICTASVLDNVPRFLKGTGQGWLTAEYSMLPRATHDRCDREASRGKQGGRTLEIQRLIGRSLRAAVDLKAFGERTVYIDCDVIQADGGTRTASITGGCIALALACQHMQTAYKLKRDPMKQWIASISVGIVDGEPTLDLDYKEDSSAHTDMNVVMTEQGGLIEVQGTAEGDQSFNRIELNQMIDLAEQGVEQLLALQKQAIGEEVA